MNTGQGSCVQSRFYGNHLYIRILGFYIITYTTDCSTGSNCTYNCCKVSFCLLPDFYTGCIVMSFRIFWINHLVYKEDAVSCRLSVSDMLFKNVSCSYKVVVGCPELILQLRYFTYFLNICAKSFHYLQTLLTYPFLKINLNLVALHGTNSANGDSGVSAGVFNECSYARLDFSFALCVFNNTKNNAVFNTSNRIKIFYLGKELCLEPKLFFITVESYQRCVSYKFC